MVDDAGLSQAIAALREDLSEANRVATEANQRAAEQNVLLLAQNRQLEDVEAKLPSFVPKTNYRRVVAVLVLAGLVVVGLVFWARAERHREAERDRRTSVARAYANCEAVNRAFQGVDVGYTYLARLSMAQQTDDEGRERVQRAHDALRSGLSRTDCDAILLTLSPEDAEKVKGEPSRTLPTLPLPPPPTS